MSITSLFVKIISVSSHTTSDTPAEEVPAQPLEEYYQYEQEQVR